MAIVQSYDTLSCSHKVACYSCRGDTPGTTYASTLSTVACRCSISRHWRGCSAQRQQDQSCKATMFWKNMQWLSVEPCAAYPQELKGPRLWSHVPEILSAHAHATKDRPAKMSSRIDQQTTRERLHLREHPGSCVDNMRSRRSEIHRGAHRMLW